jgi:hypothetical protein
MTCAYRCISPQCYDEVYANDEVSHMACARCMASRQPACGYQSLSTQQGTNVCASLQIEEGEVDTERGRQFSACFRKLHKKENDDKLAEQRKQRAAEKAAKQ